MALAEDMRLLAYVDQNQPKVQFPMEIFQEHDQVECRVDVIDSHIYVCSKEVRYFCQCGHPVSFRTRLLLCLPKALRCVA